MLKEVESKNPHDDTSEILNIEEKSNQAYSAASSYNKNKEKNSN
ncbi:2079_t:CDS:2, partial [Funneliformis geosporum]